MCYHWVGKHPNFLPEESWRIFLRFLIVLMVINVKKKNSNCIPYLKGFQKYCMPGMFSGMDHWFPCTRHAEAPDDSYSDQDI